MGAKDQGVYQNVISFPKYSKFRLVLTKKDNPAWTQLHNMFKHVD